MTTIYDIAKFAGVSPATVSRVLNGKESVSEETKQKVLQIVEDMNYIPNAAARSLVEKKSWAVALLLPDISNPFFATIARGIDDAVSDKGYSLIICNSDDSLYKERKHINILRKRRVDGIILIASRNKSSVGDLGIKNTPLVIVDRHQDTDHADFVLADNLNGARVATKHLISLGHKEIGTVTGPQNISTGAERFQGFKDAMSEADLQIDEQFIFEGDFREKSGYQMAKKMLKGSRLPTAIFAANDLMALGVMTALKEANIQIPNDMAIVGYDGIVETNYVVPQLTTIVQPNYEMGQVAGEHLIWRIGNPEEPRQKIVLSPRISIKNSSVMKQRAQI